jgi:hypothetical protein
VPALLVPALSAKKGLGQHWLYDTGSDHTSKCLHTDPMLLSLECQAITAKFTLLAAPPLARQKAQSQCPSVLSSAAKMKSLCTFCLVNTRHWGGALEALEFV